MLTVIIDEWQIVLRASVCLSVLCNIKTMATPYLYKRSKFISKNRGECVKTGSMKLLVMRIPMTENHNCVKLL